MSTNNDIVNQLNTATSTIVLVLSSFNFIVGAIGLIFNILIFTRPSLRNEPCSFCFRCSTYFNLFVIFIVIPVRILSNSFDLTLNNLNNGFCKLEYFTFHAMRSISCWIIVFACLDRYLHSSTNIRIRQMSSLKTAKIVITLITIVILLSYSHQFVYFEITYKPNRFGTIIATCTIVNVIYSVFFTFWHMTMYSICPSLFMFLFGCLTLKNLQKYRHLIQRNPRFRRTDVQLLRMLIGQVLIIVLSTLPYTIYLFYTSLTPRSTKDTYRIAQENLILRTLTTTTFSAHSSSFYFHTLMGTSFRKEFFKIIRYCSSQTRIHVIQRILPRSS